MLNPNANPKYVLLAVQKAIVATFTPDMWNELGVLTDCEDIITEDERLLRSLHFGDDDYGTRVTMVVEQILKKNPNHVYRIEQLVELEGWLKKNDSHLYVKLYEPPTLATTEIERIEQINKNVIQKHISRINNSLPNDPAQAIGSAKELLESVMKSILKSCETEVFGNIPHQLKLVQKQLDIDPNDKNSKLNEKCNRILNNFGQIITGVAEIRNLSGTGHGRSEDDDVSANHAALVVNSVMTVSMYLVGLWEEKRKNSE